MLLLGQSPVFIARLTLDTLVSFHWLRAPQRIQLKLTVIVYRTLHGIAPRYLSDMLSRIADISSQSRLRSSTSSQPMVRPSRLVTDGERSLASAGPRLWNSLPDTSRPPRHCQTFVVNVINTSFSAIIPGNCLVVFTLRWTLKLFLTAPSSLI